MAFQKRGDGLMGLQRRSGHGWPKEHRLRKRREFLLVQRKARKRVTTDLVILWMRGRSPSTRLGITVSRKVAKQATKRNRIKRWIRESFRQTSQEGRPALDVVVIARPRAVRASYETVDSQLRDFWRQVAPASPAGSD